MPCVKRPFQKSIHYDKHSFIHHKSFCKKPTSCKLITKLLKELQHSKTFIRNEKKHNHNKVSYNYLGSPTQADHSSGGSQYSHLFFILFICFNCGKLKKTLVTCNVQKPDFLIFSSLTKEQEKQTITIIQKNSTHFSLIRKVQK